MVWVVSRIRLKVETSARRSHESINNDWIHERVLLAGGDLTKLTAASTSAHRVPKYSDCWLRKTEKKNSFRPHHGPGIDSAPSENKYKEHFLGVKAAGAWGWQTHYLHVPMVVEIWEPKAPEILWATPGLLRDCFTFTFYLAIYLSRLFFCLSISLSVTKHKRDSGFGRSVISAFFCGVTQFGLVLY